MDTVERIADLGSGADGPPTQPIVIAKATLAKG